MRKLYVEKKISIPRSLAYYCKAKINIELITYKDLSLIKKGYKDYLTTNNLPLKDDNNESEVSNFYTKVKQDIYNDSSSSENSESEDMGSEFLDNNNNKYDDDDDGKDGFEGSSNDKINKIKDTNSYNKNKEDKKERKNNKKKKIEIKMIEEKKY